MGIKPVTPDWPPLELGELELLSRRVPEMGAPLQVAWHSPRPFSAAARVRTVAGEFFVKRHDARVRDSEGLHEEHRYLAHLRARGIEVPRPLESGDGSTAVSLGASTYEVHAIAPGVDAYRDELSWVPARSAGNARALGAALARLHLAAQGFERPARALRPLLAGFDVVGSADLVAALDRRLVALPAAKRYLDACEGRARILAQIEDAHAVLMPQLLSLDPLWVHNDWHASNLFWSGNGADAQVRAVIDFGLCNLGCAMADLATALERNTIAWLDRGSASGAGSIGRPGLARALVEGYRTVRPLTVAEGRALPLLLPLAHVEYALSELEYFDGVVANEENARLAYPEFLLGHVEWFRSFDGRVYLAEIEKAVTS